MYIKSSKAAKILHILRDAQGYSDQTYCGLTPKDRWIDVMETDANPEDVCKECLASKNDDPAAAIEESLSRKIIPPLFSFTNLDSTDAISKIRAFEVLYGRQPDITVHGSWDRAYNPATRKWQEVNPFPAVVAITKVKREYLVTFDGLEIAIAGVTSWDFN
jgi:hypothetical protein